ADGHVQDPAPPRDEPELPLGVDAAGARADGQAVHVGEAIGEAQRRHAAVDGHAGEAGALEVEVHRRIHGGEIAAPPFQVERGVCGRLGQSVDEAVEPERVDAARHGVAGLGALQVEAAYQI